MLLPFSAYIDALAEYAVSSSGAPDTPIAAIANNSTESGDGTLFCAVKGSRTDGHQFLPEVIAKGAAAVVISAENSRLVPEHLPHIRVRDSYAAWAKICETFYGFPGKEMDVFAVTGTNGKTTIAYLLRKIFHRAFPADSCGLLSTVEYDTGGSDCREAVRTTPDALTFQKLFTEMKQNHCPRAVMELSSHGLHQHRTASLKFAGAAFTNLTGDHLDYHGDMENYFQAKRILFTGLLRKDAPAAINADDPYGQRLCRELQHSGYRVYGLTLHGEPDAEVRATDLKLNASGADFVLRTPEHELHIHSTMTGEYNVCNLSLAAILALSAGVKPELLEQLFAEKELAPPGRLQAFELPGGVRAFVDYAHTDDALSRVLTALRQVAPGRIVTVFGCGGDRDKTKRPRMAKAASELSDEIIITSDNPRTEDPLSILEEIRRGVPAGREYTLEPDRAKAIHLAAEKARKGDFILVAGKGHENYQEINGVKYPFDDRQVLCEIIRKRSVK